MQRSHLLQSNNPMSAYDFGVGQLYSAVTVIKIPIWTLVSLYVYLESNEHQETLDTPIA